MKNVMAVLAICCTMVGCVSTRHLPMKPEAAQAVTGKSLTHARYVTPRFNALTPGTAVGSTASDAQVREGEKIVDLHKVEDPAISLVQEVSRRMQEKYGMVPLATTPVEVTTDDEDTLAESHPQSDLLLDFRTVYWGLSYFPLNWTHYRILYSVKARLIDLTTREILAEGFCKYIPEETDDAPTYDELLADDALLLKQELRKGADYCLESFKTSIFKL